MKDSRKIILRLTAILFLFNASTMLSGCSILGGAYDAVMWAPKKLWSVTGDKLFGVHNEQQTDMGPRRKPSGNPQGGGAVPGYPSETQGSMPQSSSSQPQGNNDPSNYPAISPYGETIPSPQQGSAQPGYPPMPPMPQIPQAYQQPTTINKQQIRPITGDLQPPDVTDSTDPDGGADAAYARGGIAKEKKKGWGIPFISNNYKMEMRYEPLSADFIVAKNDTPASEAPEEYLAPQDSVLRGGAAKNKARQENMHGDANKSTRATSMFPLDKYAPVPSGAVQSMKEQPDSTYPKLGRVPERPQNLESPANSATELEDMKKEAQQSEIRKDNIHNIPSDATNTKTEDSHEANKIDELPLVKRRPTPNSSHEDAKKDPVAVAPEALKNDAVLMDNITHESLNKSPISEKNEEAKKGFFASLHDKIFKPAPKQVWRKSEPPVTNRPNNVGDNSEPVVEQSLPSFNMPDNVSNKQPAVPEANNLNALPGKNYDTDQGSLLPKSRYTDRRKVPQQD